MSHRPSPFQFVTHESTHSKRQRELSVSRAKAHAARVSFRPWYGHESRTLLKQADRTTSPDTIPRRLGGQGKTISSPPNPESGPNDEHAGHEGESVPIQGANHHAYDPWQMSFGYRADPFRCLPGSDERLILLALDFLYSVMLNSFNTSNQANETVNIWSRRLMPLMSTFEPLFHVVMAIIFQGYDRMAQARQHLVWRELFLQKHKAISKLRARLSQPDALADDRIILTMLYLSLLDKGLGESEAQNIHHRQAMMIVEARGGPGALKGELFAGALAQLTESSVDSTGVSPGGTALEEHSQRSNSLKVVYRKMMGRRYDTDISSPGVAVAPRQGAVND